jgi:nitroreductase
MSWLDPTDFATVIEAAIRAPSMHNNQPWRFAQASDEVSDGINVLIDPARGLSVADASGRASRLSCGAALFNLRLALAVRGTPARVRLMPEPGNPYLLARLTAEPPHPPTPVETSLYEAIPRRRSNRAPFLDRPVAVRVRIDLIAAARAENAWLDLLLGPAAVDATVELVHAADQILNRNDAYRAELTSWTRADGRAIDGVPGSVGGPSPDPYDLLRRDLDGRDRPGPVEFEREPLLAVLGGRGERPADEVQVGQALQRVLLTATDLGLSASLFSQPIEVVGVREQLRLALGRRAAPQMLLRFGYAAPAPASQRRPVSEVVAG